jgi:hypothetical protein
MTSARETAFWSGAQLRRIADTRAVLAQLRRVLAELSMLRAHNAGHAFQRTVRFLHSRSRSGRELVGEIGDNVVKGKLHGLASSLS